MLKPISDGSTILMESCLRGYDDIVAKLLQKYEELSISVNLNQKCEGKGALECACIKGSFKCVQLLLKNQSDYSAFEAMKYACEQSNVEILKELLEYEKNNNRKKSDARYWVGKETENLKEMFKLLTDYGVSFKKKCVCFQHISFI